MNASASYVSRASKPRSSTKAFRRLWEVVVAAAVIVSFASITSAPEAGSWAMPTPGFLASVSRELDPFDSSKPCPVKDGDQVAETGFCGHLDVTFDPAGNMYVSGLAHVWRVDKETDQVKLVAGDADAPWYRAQGFSGDGGPATNAKLQKPHGVAVSASGDIYIADTLNHRVRRVDHSTGVITTLVGTGDVDFNGDGLPGDQTNLRQPYDVVLAPDGDLVIADSWHQRVRRYDSATGTVSTIAGIGTNNFDGGFSGDGGPAIAAKLRFPSGVDYDHLGNLYVADTGNNRIRRVEAATGNISSIAGSGSSCFNNFGGFSGDGGPATAAVLGCPNAVAIDPAGNVLISDYFNSRIRRVGSDGVISTIAGNGSNSQTSPCCDGMLATEAGFGETRDIASDDAGNVYFIGDTRDRVLVVGSDLVAATGDAFHGLAPYRALDSRTPTVWPGKLVAGADRDVQIGGAGLVPDDASAVAMNVTVTNPTSASFVTVWPTGQARPTASNLNFAAGATNANLVIVKLGDAGSVSFSNAVGATDVVVDVVGYFGDGDTPGGLFNPRAPVRVLDSRTDTGGWSGALNAYVARDLQVRPGAVPATAQSVIANVTVTGSTANSFLTVWPGGLPKPTASTMNFAAGETRANLVVMPIGDDGNIRFATSAGATHVIVDIVGYFDPTVGSYFHPITPSRVLDDRIGLGLAGPWGPGQTRKVAVSPTAPSDATAIVANLTATNGTAGSFVTTYPTRFTRPNASTLNFGPGQTLPNLSVVRTGAGDAIDVYNEQGSVDLVADVSGYFAPL